MMFWDFNGQVTCGVLFKRSLVKSLLLQVENMVRVFL